jgi:dipeptidyl aminopeptidase/acylaminoacyl peptidase
MKLTIKSKNGMNRYTKTLFAALIVCFNAIAQKPAIDSTTFGKWPSIENVQISNDGKYDCYTVSDKIRNVSILYIVSNKDLTSLQIENVSSPVFTEDSHLVLFMKGKDTLGVFSVVDKKLKYIPGITSFKVQEGGDGSGYAYMQNTAEKSLIIHFERNRSEKVFKDVKDYFFSKDGKILVVQSAYGADESNRQTIIWDNLTTGMSYVIWEGINPGKFSFDDRCQQMAFIASEKETDGKRLSLCYYAEGMKQAITLIKSDTVMFNRKFVLDDQAVKFSKDGDKLLFGVNKQQMSTIAPKKGYSGVDVWNYKDPFLQPAQSSNWLAGAIATQYWAVANLKTGKYVQLNNKGEEVSLGSGFEDYLLVSEQNFSTAKYHPYGEYYSSVYLVSTNNGVRKKLMVTRGFGDGPEISPDGQYASWFDYDSLNYFSYEIASGVIRKITNKGMPPFYDQIAGRVGKKYTPLGVAGWSMERHSILLYDKFDIWEVDLKGEEPSKNVTNRYGAKHKVVFSVVVNNDREHFDQFQLDKGLLLTGFDPLTKKNGFWLTMGFDKDPVMLSMDDYSYDISRTTFTGLEEVPNGFTPRKAKFTSRYIVQRERVDEFPNLFVTDDFKTYRPISDLHPEKLWNWLRAELVSWKMPDGKMSQGILYKPENFDFTKRYPLIFYYYQKLSNDLNDYIEPEYSNGRINVSYYVSNGYLVFEPDIYYKEGHNGEGVVNSVVSAAKFLSKLSCVDSTKMGLQGHSFGGWETNFLVTHSNIFAAACAAAGLSDEVSDYDALIDGASRQESYEGGTQASPHGIGVTPWTYPQLYIENSPIFSVGQIVTPLLLSHGSKDQAVPFAQAVEMFQAMRRASKKVWLLEYTNAGHILNSNDAKDFTIRMKQFFDHYLKGAPAPKWMTCGVPASLKSIDSGFELDSSGRKP